MSHPTTTHSTTDGRPRRARWRLRTALAVLPLAALAAAGAGSSSASPSTATGPHAGHPMRTEERVAAVRASAGFQDLAVAEAAGYASTLGTLGCFQDPSRGGMGVHYLDEGLLDATVDMTEPEALVYELDASGDVVGLVAHEYIVPIDAWTSSNPPRLFGMDFHRHATLPLWVLHAWLWKDNPAGMFEDWNPAVRLCPPGVPVFGTDLPAPSPEP